MINRKTVFVLGAGAHIPYGFMDGSDLIKAILAALPAPPHYGTNDFSGRFFDIHDHRVNVPRDALTQFRAALNLGGHTSIDSFLATHAKRTGFTDIGKFAVAYRLLPLEFQHAWLREPHDGDWMTFLFESMLHGCLNSVDDFLQNNDVDFVTFNYDRTFEDFLCTRLAHTYNLTPAIAWEKAKKFSVVHVYGSLGEFDPSIITSKRPAVTPFNSSQLLVAASSIRLMYDDRTDHSGVSRAIELISSAHCVCFLGFGFDPDNIRRLTLNTCCANVSKWGVFATRYEAKVGDWNRIVNNMAPTHLNAAFEHFERQSSEWDCLEFLHQTAALG